MDTPQELQDAPHLASATRRSVARTIDMSFAAIFGELVYSALIIVLYGSQVETTFFHLALRLMVLAFLVVSMDTAFTYRLGQSPGKILTGIKVVSASPEPLTKERAMERSLQLWLRGFCLGLPLLQLFGVLMALIRIRKTGNAYWDDIAQTRVVRLQPSDLPPLTNAMHPGFLFLNIISLVAVLPWPVLVMTSIFMFDAPGSNNLVTMNLAITVLYYPLPAILGNVLYWKIRKTASREALWLVTAITVSGYVTIILFLVLLQVRCGGTFSCISG